MVALTQTQTQSKHTTNTKLTNATKKDAESPPEASGRNFWLLKAEPESRLEKGKDIKFSIDDLAAKTEPEPWDGMSIFYLTLILAVTYMLK